MSTPVPPTRSRTASSEAAEATARLTPAGLDSARRTATSNGRGATNHTAHAADDLLEPHWLTAIDAATD